MDKFVPLHGLILIRILKDDNQSNLGIRHGYIDAIGDELKTNKLNLNDKVVFNDIGFQIVIESVDYILINYENILGILND